MNAPGNYKKQSRNYSKHSLDDTITFQYHSSMREYWSTVHKWGVDKGVLHIYWTYCTLMISKSNISNVLSLEGKDGEKKKAPLSTKSERGEMGERDIHFKMLFPPPKFLFKNKKTFQSLKKGVW